MQQTINLGLELEVFLVQASALGKSKFILVREGDGFSKIKSKKKKKGLSPSGRSLNKVDFNGEVGEGVSITYRQRCRRSSNQLSLV